MGKKKKNGKPIDARLPWVRALTDLDEAWGESAPGQKARELMRRGERVGDALREGPRVVSVRTLPLSGLLYPTKNAFNSACLLPFPFVQMIHRALLVQVDAGGETKNVLFNPTDVDAARATPFFRRMIDAFGPTATEMARKKFPPIEAQLATLGLRCEDIDLVAYDHFHTQDLRPILGTTSPLGNGPLAARFPNALLLAPRNEWDAWDDLHPMQRAWFVDDGKAGVPEDRVVFTSTDLEIGAGCLLLRTPGHTVGNQTLFVHADDGVFGCSENGCSADNWTPRESRIPGIAAFARSYDVDVILNANTPEIAGEQYFSMLLERSVVDRIPDAPAFVQMFPSSEVTPHLLAPGLRPTVIVREHASGNVRKRVKAEDAARVEARL